MKKLFIGIVVLYASCSDNTRNSQASIRKGDTVLRGNIIGDTLLNDTIKYYDLSEQLISIKVFKNGIQEGMAVDFYSNGNPMIVSNYSNGLKNGYNNYYDSTGRCFYRDYYYYDLIVGPITYMDDKGNPKRYFFSNLENETLMHVDYANWNGIKGVVSNCINFTTNTLKEDSVKVLTLLLYLINPPKFSFSYSIFKKKKASDDNFIEVEKVESNLPFVRLTLPDLPTDETYSVGLKIYDSILNKQTVVYKDL